jgi:hypothetical protein
MEAVFKPADAILEMRHLEKMSAGFKAFGCATAQEWAFSTDSGIRRQNNGSGPEQFSPSV